MILRKLFRFIGEGHVHATWIQGLDHNSVVLSSKDEMLDMTFEQNRAADICYLDKRKNRIGLDLFIDSAACLSLGIIVTTIFLAARLVLSLQRPRAVASVEEEGLHYLMAGVAKDFCEPDILRKNTAEDALEITSSNGKLVISFKN